MRDANRLVRHRRGVGQGWAPAGVGCLILLLCGCVPAVVMTSTYVDKRDQSEEPAQVSSASADQTQTDQRPLLTTKNYRDPAGGGQESTQVYRATLDQVWAAALKALTQLKASVTNSTRDQAGGEIAGRWVGGPAAGDARGADRCDVDPGHDSGRAIRGPDGRGCHPRRDPREPLARTCDEYSARLWCLCALAVRRKCLG